MLVLSAEADDAEGVGAVCCAMSGAAKTKSDAHTAAQIPVFDLVMVVSLRG
jgi:hypothetical protein